MVRREFSIRRISDMHCHFRQDAVLPVVVPATAEFFGYAVAMPNTTPPITTGEDARDYVRLIRQAGASYQHFTPLGIAYLTDTISPDEIRKGFEGTGHHKAWVAAKLYPKGATTNSKSGVTDIKNVYPVLEVMQEIGMPLLVHGEVLHRGKFELARWEREAEFVRKNFRALLKDFPTLKVVLEHISTAYAANFVLAEQSGRLAATITPHHLLFTDADVSRGGLWPDANCLPIIKTALDRMVLRSCASSGDPRFFAGTDSAPHDTASKYCSCCSFGAFVAPGAVSAYAEVFHQEGVFDTDDGVERFEKFMSLNGPAFYGLTPSPGTVRFTYHEEGVTIDQRYIVPSPKLLGRDKEIVPLFHTELGLTPRFHWQPHNTTPY